MKKLIIVSLIVIASIIAVGSVSSELMPTHYGSMPKPGN